MRRLSSKCPATFAAAIMVLLVNSFAAFSAPAIANAATPGSQYMAQPGDTALDIALFYDVEPAHLAGLNELPANTVAAGQSVVLELPTEVTTSDQPSAVTNDAAEESSTGATVDIRPESYVVAPGDTLFRIAQRFGISLHSMIVANNLAGPDFIFSGQTLVIPDLATAAQYDLQPLPQATPETVDLPLLDEALTGTGGAYDTGPGKVITVNLSYQTAYAFENGVLLREFVVSTGLPATPTVTGTYSIYLKLDSQRMVGPGYDLPGVPWVMYFYQGYGLHGTYWHSNFGQPMSHGCVNMVTSDAAWLYSWAPIGTTVVVSY